MTELYNSPFFGLFLTIAAFYVGSIIQKKTKWALANPLIIAICLLIASLLIFKIPFDAYQQGGSIITMFLGPATACLAVSIYHKRQYLKSNLIPIIVGSICGCITSMGSIFIMCHLFHLDDKITKALLPKSVTMPIALGVTDSLGGLAPFTVAAVVFTGIFGNLLAPTLIKIFRVKDPAVAGLSIGACSHALGTSRAIELGETEGAMSGLAIGICGIITVILSLFF